MKNFKVIIKTNALTKAAENYAKSLKLKKIRIFIAERENKSKRYIVVWNGEVIYETPLYEQIGARLDVLKITREMSCSEFPNKWIKAVKPAPR